MFFFSAVPFIEIMIANVYFLYSLLTRNFGVKTETVATWDGQSSGKENARRKAQAERNYVILLMFLTLSFRVLSMIALILNVVTYQLTLDSKHNIELRDFLIVVAELFGIMNTSLNFVLYFASGNTFRNGFKTAMKHYFC